MMRKTLRIVLFALMMPMASWAQQTLTLYEDGTATNYYVPFNGYKAGTYNQKSQFIIPASDLEDLVGMTVTKLTFYSSSYYHTGNWPDAVFKVYLTTTNQATFSNSPVSPVDWESLANNVAVCRSATARWKSS